MDNSFSKLEEPIEVPIVSTNGILSDEDANDSCKALMKHPFPCKPYDWLELHKRAHNDSSEFELSPTKVFIDNLIESTTKSQLRSHLAAQFGPLSRLQLMRRRRTSFSSQLTGSAIAEFASAQSAVDCLAAESYQLTLHGSPCPLAKDGRGRRRCNRLRVSPFYERALRQSAGAAAPSGDEDPAEAAEHELIDVGAQRASEHAAQCVLALLNPMAFRAILEWLGMNDWFRLLEVCSCSYHRVRLSLSATRQFRLDSSLFRRGFPEPSPVLTDALCLRLLRQLPTTLTCLTVNLADYSRCSISGQLLVEVARHFPGLESLELVPVRLTAAHCRSAASAGLQRLSRLRLLPPPPPRQFVSGQNSPGVFGFGGVTSNSGFGDRIGEECDISEDGLWHLLKIVGPGLEELRVPAASLTGKCFHFLTDRLTSLELLGVASPRVLNRLADSACCRSLRRLIVVAAQPLGGHRGRRAPLPDWLGWQPEQLYARLSRLSFADFAGRGVCCSARHVELPPPPPFFGQHPGTLVDIGPARRAERWLALLSAFNSVSCLMLTDTSVDDRCLQAVTRQLSCSLRVLCLTHCSRISATGFSVLADCQRLLRLRVSCTEFDLGVSSRLPPPGLEELGVASCHRLGQPLQPGVLRRLLALRQLVSLDLSFCVGLPTVDEIADCLRRTDAAADGASATTTAAAALTVYCRGVSLPFPQDRIDAMRLTRRVSFNDNRFHMSSAAAAAARDKWSDTDWSLVAAAEQPATSPAVPMCPPIAWLHLKAVESARHLELFDVADHFNGNEFGLGMDEYEDYEYFDEDDDDIDEFDNDDFSYDESDDGY